MYKKVPSTGLRAFKFITFIIFIFVVLSNYQFINYDNGNLYILSLEESNSDFESILGLKKVKYCEVDYGGSISYETYIYTNGSILYGGDVSQGELTLIKASMKILGVEVEEYNRIPFVVLAIGFLVIVLIPTKTKVYYIERSDDNEKD